MTTDFRDASVVEQKDIGIMLRQRGVKPVSASVNAWGEKQTARKGGGGLWSIVNSFRADKQVRDAGDTVKSRKPKKNKQPDISIAVKSTTALLKEHGYAHDIIEDALKNAAPI